MHYYIQGNTKSKTKDLTERKKNAKNGDSKLFIAVLNKQRKRVKIISLPPTWTSLTIIAYIL